MTIDIDPVAAATALVRGQFVSLSIRAAVELGVFDALVPGPDPTGPNPLVAVPLDELARQVSVAPAPLARLLTVLTDLALVVATEPQTDAGTAYEITPVGSTFAKGHRSRLRDLVLMRTERSVLDSWQRLAEALRTDGAVFETVHGVDYWAHLAAHPDQETRFNGAMARRGEEQAEALVAAGALDGTRVLVDVGGGEGAMVTELLSRHPGLRGVVADRPEITTATNAAFSRQGLADRAYAAPADFFVEVPTGGDSYVLSNVLHDWDDEDCLRILRTVRAAMMPGAQLWVVERLLDADRSVDALRELHLVDLHMLVLFGARERTRAEYDGLLLASGFTGTTVVTGDAWDVIGVMAD
jgi:hypothetical protein